MPLDPKPLENAIARLREGLARYQREPDDEQLRDGLIQRLEFTYELSHRTLRRYLAEPAASPNELMQLPFAELIRTASAQGLLRSGWPAWRRFREIRTPTSHTYDQTTAAAVVAEIPAFLNEAEHLFVQLQRRLA
jgi:nucleotidyltransferase substrate binding protein (TIGR01987 family)